MRALVPILGCEEAKAFESEFFAGEEAREWDAMQGAARGVAAGILADFAEIGAFPSRARVLVLVGKGHNAGDALLTALTIRNRYPDTRIDVVFAFGQSGLRPLARRAWESLALIANVVRSDGGDWADGYDVAIDGVFGFQFRPPVPEAVAAMLRRANETPIRLRAAVDLPSGLDAPDAFRADFTYATGIMKAPLPDLANAGRVRFVDLGFPLPPVADSGAALLTHAILDGLRGLRPPRGDKRHHGHPLIVAGSRRYPGAALMAALAALRAGAGLVTVAVPESLVPAFAAQAPEAIWLGLPETPDGGLALEGLHLVREAFVRCSAVVIGPGMGRERETLALAAEIATLSPHPLVIDADALQPEIVAMGSVARVLTPHTGEYARIEKAIPQGTVVVRKGPVTRIQMAGQPTTPIIHSFFGGPVLARGGSGDLLAGMTGALLALTPDDPAGAAARAVGWHGLAADMLSRARGATAVRTTELLEYLAPVLRG